MTTSGHARDTTVRSVNRALSILQVLARTGPVGVTRIAEELGIHKSTVFRLLTTLEERGMVEQNASRGEYRIGYGVLQIAEGAVRRHDLSLISRPVCQELADEVGETVNVALRDGADLITIDQVIGGSVVTTVNWVGQRIPLHATSAGKVLLAALPEDELSAIVDAGLKRFTEHTVVDPVELRKQLDEVRKLGYGCTIDELEIGLASIGAPIRSLHGDVVAAIALSGPTLRVNTATLPAMVDRLTDAAAAISQRNGYPVPG
jgi:IclR family transcriptional regulator, acetate operon repressor